MLGTASRTLEWRRTLYQGDADSEQPSLTSWSALLFFVIDPNSPAGAACGAYQPQHTKGGCLGYPSVSKFVYNDIAVIDQFYVLLRLATPWASSTLSRIHAAFFGSISALIMCANLDTVALATIVIDVIIEDDGARVHAACDRY